MQQVNCFDYLLKKYPQAIHLELIWSGQNYLLVFILWLDPGSANYAKNHYYDYNSKTNDYEQVNNNNNKKQMEKRYAYLDHLQLKGIYISNQHSKPFYLTINESVKGKSFIAK
ncbi:unnamed protein product [Cunninghamella blakesleeana]